MGNGNPNQAEMGAQREITRAELEQLRRHGYAERRDGVWHVLALGRYGTTIEPVTVRP